MYQNCKCRGLSLSIGRFVWRKEQASEKAKERVLIWKNEKLKIDCLQLETTTATATTQVGWFTGTQESVWPVELLWLPATTFGIDRKEKSERGLFCWFADLLPAGQQQCFSLALNSLHSQPFLFYFVSTLIHPMHRRTIIIYIVF